MGSKRLALGWILFAVASACIPFFTRALATASSTWIASPTLTLNKVRDMAPGEPIPYSLNGNRDCTDRKVITRPGRLLPVPQAEQSHISCNVDTGYGAVSASGYLQRQGTTVSGEVRQPSGGLANVIPVPGSNTAVRYSGGPVTGLYLHFTTSFDTTLKSSAIVNGSVLHTATQPTTASLKDKSGSLIAAHTDSLAFSAGGQWMVVDAPSVGMIRVNLNSFDVLPFADSYNYNIGVAPGIQSAISSDGRFAVEFSKSFGRFMMYDLSTCGAVPLHITGKASCPARDLYALIQSKVPGFVAVGTIRFINNDALSLYVAYKEGSATKIGQYVLSLPGADIPSFEYLALGDSFAAGEGAYQYKALTDTKDNKCHLSLRSYPYLIAQNMTLNKYESVACSGAKIEDINILSDDYDGQVSDQIKKKDRINLSEIISNFLPGYIAQKEFIQKHSPNIVTISAVGNDIGFTAKIRRCLEPDTCFSTYEDRLEVVREINSQFDRLVEMYKQLKQNSLPQTKIYVLGYPQLAKPGGNCGLNVRLNNQEVAFSQLLITYLNSVIRQATSKAGVAYVDVEDALNGHRLCEAITPDEIAVNGLTAGNDIIQRFGGPVGNESYHPNYTGQQLLANQVQTRTNNFTLPMPPPNNTAQPPAESNNLALLQAAKSGRPVQRINYDENLGNDVMYRQQWWQGTIDTTINAIPPLKTFKVWLHSDPLDLGSFASDSSGNLSFQLKLPDTTPTGFHSLHVMGTNVAGELIDVYKTVYVAASEADYDGDGIANAQDPCAVIEPTGVDVDQDGTDDGCDNWIGPPPPLVTTIVSIEDSQLGSSLSVGPATLPANPQAAASPPSTTPPSVVSPSLVLGLTTVSPNLLAEAGQLINITSAPTIIDTVLTPGTIRVASLAAPTAPETGYTLGASSTGLSNSNEAPAKPSLNNLAKLDTAAASQTGEASGISFVWFIILAGIIIFTLGIVIVM